MEFLALGNEESSFSELYHTHFSVATQTDLLQRHSSILIFPLIQLVTSVYPVNRGNLLLSQAQF
jgi:hypothetical protein